MLRSATAVVLVAILISPAYSLTANFSSLTAGTRYVKGATFLDGGITFDVVAGTSNVFISTFGTTNPAITGNFLNLTSQMEVAVNLPTGASRIDLDFSRGYPDGGFRINGTSIPYTAVPTTVNGVTITNILGSKTSPWGSITAVGSLESFALIGTEFFVDNLAVTPSPEPVGDYNDDNVVDSADYVWWRNNANNRSGFLTWRSSFNPSLIVRGASSNVPEPTAFFIAGVMGMTGLLSRRSCGRGENS